jgi:hypothetical protein
MKPSSCLRSHARNLTSLSRHSLHHLKSRRLLAGCRKKRASQPIRFCLPGTMNSIIHGSCFIRRQAYGKDNGNTLRRKPRPTHFLVHTKNDFSKRKSLTGLWTFVYKCLVSNCEIWFCRKNARTSLARLANQRHPAVTGAGMERLAMDADTFQAARSNLRSRSLKIEATGDFYRKKITPRIRITGKWLERAGFRPGHRVEIRFEQPGTLTLRFMEQANQPAL